jgi:hypothetical protein
VATNLINHAFNEATINNRKGWLWAAFRNRNSRGMGMVHPNPTGTEAAVQALPNLACSSSGCVPRTNIHNKWVNISNVFLGVLFAA